MSSPSDRRLHLNDSPLHTPAGITPCPWFNSRKPSNQSPAVNRVRKHPKPPVQQQRLGQIRPRDLQQRLHPSMLHEQGAREKQRPNMGGKLMAQSRDRGSTMSSDELVFASVASSSCNLDSFLECTMPKLQCKYMPKSFVRAGAAQLRRPFEEERVPFYTLGDLWDSFDEWSAYGAGVPINLPSGETVVQYYVPYLSALQIYGHNTVFGEKRNMGDDSDLSDAELRESSSEASTSDDDPHKSMSVQFDSWKLASARSEDSESFSSEERCGHEGDRGHLIFEFFERSAPYGRAPLSDKIAELAAECPKLRQLRSVDLSSASWVSVAWYPIYRIPTGPTLRNLAACFLTFHSLSMPLQGIKEAAKMERKGEIQEAETKVELRAFGLASYKLRRGKGNIDEDDEQGRRVTSLHHSADSWLKRYKVCHPDFNFFTSHTSPPYSSYNIPC